MACRKLEIRQILRHSTRRLYRWALCKRADEVELWWDRQYYQHSLCSLKTNSSKKYLKNFEVLKNVTCIIESMKNRQVFQCYETWTSFFRRHKKLQVSSKLWKTDRFFKFMKKLDKYLRRGEKNTRFFRRHEKITSFFRVMRNRQVSQIYEKLEVSLKKWWKSQV